MDDVSRCAGGYRGTALTRRPFLLLATVSRSWRLVSLGTAQGAVGAKHAVNPSMGARSRHPWRSRFCTHCALRRFRDHQRLLVPPGSREKKDQIQIQIQIQRQKPKPQCPLLLLLLLLYLPLLPPWGLMRPRPQGTVMGGRGPQPGPLAPRMAPSSPHGWVYGVSWLRPPASQAQQKLGAKRLNPALYSDSPDSRRRSR